MDDQQSALDFIAERKLKALDLDNMLFFFTSKLYAPCVAWVELSLPSKAKVKQREISATWLGSLNGRSRVRTPRKRETRRENQVSALET